jgi:hypothetical protein
MPQSTENIDVLLSAYRTLDVDIRASADAIRHRYLELVRRHHPDRWPAGSPQQELAAGRMRDINAAHDLIESAPLRDHVFACEPVADHQSTPSPDPFGRPVSVMVETLARFTFGVTVGLLFVFATHSRRLPGIQFYGFAIPLLLGFAFTSNSGRVWNLLRIFWWWW